MDTDTQWAAGVEEASIAADAAEHEAVTAYVRRHPLVAVVVDAMRRAESVARLEAALRVAA
jgi:hypothetical protein